MFKVILLLNLLFTLNVLCYSVNNDTLKNDNSFWINPCGYTTKINPYGYITSNAEGDYESDADIMDRILTLATKCQNNINMFKFKYIKQTLNTDYSAHYDRSVNLNNFWITSRLLNKAEDNMSQSSLNFRSFPGELKFTYELLQRVSVGFEILLDDASKKNASENLFSNNFITCKNDLQQLLCEISHGIDDTKQEKPKDITRDEVPEEVLKETSTAKRNLTNSIIFRDFMISIKYVKDTYDYLRSKCIDNTYSNE